MFRWGTLGIWCVVFRWGEKGGQRGKRSEGKNFIVHSVELMTTRRRSGRLELPWPENQPESFMSQVKTQLNL